MRDEPGATNERDFFERIGTHLVKTIETGVEYGSFPL